jgi:hypothetical protein
MVRIGFLPYSLTVTIALVGTLLSRTEKPATHLCARLTRAAAAARTGSPRGSTG